MQSPDLVAGASAVRVVLAPELQGRASPVELRIGQELWAEVLNMGAKPDERSGNHTAVLSMAGRRFQAQVPADFQQGQVVRLAVADTSADRLVLRVVPPAEESGGPEGTPPPALEPATILADLDLPNTPPLAAAAAALVETEQPLTRPALSLIRAAVTGQPGPVEANARAAAQLLAKGLPLTARALELARAVQLQAPSVPLGELLGELILQTAQALEAAPDAKAPVQEAPLDPDEAEKPQTAPSGAGSGSASTQVSGRGAAFTSSLGSARGRASAGGPNGGLARLRAALGQLAAASPEAAELQRVVELYAEGPEAKLAQAPSEAEPPAAAAPQAEQATGEPAVLAPPSGGMVQTTLAAPDARSLLMEVLTAAQSEAEPALPQDVAPSLAAPLSDAPLADAALPNAPLANASSPAASAQSAATSRSGEAAPAPQSAPPATAPRVAAATGGASMTAADAAAAAPPQPAPNLGAAVQALARALHDRIEMQQLSNAAALAQGAAPPARGGHVASNVSLTLGVPAQPTAGGVEGQPLFAAPGAAGGQPSGAPGTPGAGQTTLALTVPLAFGGQLATLQLEVQREPPSRQEASEGASESVRAHFSLQLQRLGEVGADLRLTGTTLRCRLSADSPRTQAVLSGAVQDLHARLEEAGFRVDTLECVPPTPPAALPRTVVRRVDVGV